MGKYEWVMYVALAGLAWGTYVPIIFYGGTELGPERGPAGANARLMAILCVGVAYFLIGVLLPLGLFLTGQYQWPAMRPNGLIFSSLAGVAGAVGAICVIFATQAAVQSALGQQLPPATFRVFIAPLIFGLAPVINVLVSTVWHPHRGAPLHFELKMPHPLLWVGILLVGAGAALVLYSKELSEASATKTPPPAPPAEKSTAITEKPPA